MTKKKKITIAASVIAAAVLIFAIVMFSIWANVDLCEKDVEYKTLQKKLDDYYIVPTGLDEEIDGVCRVTFPRAEENSNHRYGKYTNLTIRYKYATGYSINVKSDNISGHIAAVQKQAWRDWHTTSYEEVIAFCRPIEINDKEVYFTTRTEEYRDVIIVEMYYIQDAQVYSVSTRGKSKYEDMIFEYAENLVKKVLI